MKALKQILALTMVMFTLSPLCAQSYEWKPFSLFPQRVRDTSMHFFKVDSAHFNWTKYAPYRSKRYHVLSRNESGMMTYAEQWERYASEYDSIWKLNNRFFTSYFEGGNIDTYRKDYWNPDTNDWVLCEKQVQRENGQLIEYISKGWSTYPPACGGSKETYAYNEFDSITENARYSWNLLSNYWKSERRQYSYNNNHQKEQMIFQNGDSNNEWENITRIDYFYTGDLCTEWICYSWNTTSNFWKLSSKRVNVYDQNDQLIQWTYFRYQDDGSLLPSQRMTRTYNEFQKIIEGSDSQYDTIASEWELFYFRTWDYQNDTLFYEHNWYHWRADTGIFWNSWKQKLIYNDILDITQCINYDGFWNHWDTSDSYNYHYDDLERVTQYRHYKWLPNYHEVWNELYFWDQSVGMESLSNTEKSPSLKIFPNPAGSFFQVEVPKPYHNGEMLIYNNLGRLVYSSELDRRDRIQIQLEQPDGIYIIKLINSTSTISGKLILVNQ